MDVLRRHLFFIVCGVVSAGGIALGVTGLRAMPRVVDAMKGAEGLHQSLQGLKRNLVNEARIALEQQRIDEIKADYADLLGRAKGLYRYEPLVDDVLPDGNADKRRQFRGAYETAMDALLESLGCGGPPTPADVREAETRRKDEEFRDQPHGYDPGVLVSGRPDKGPKRTAAGVLTAEGVRADAESRASIRCAQQVFLYCVPFVVDAAKDRVSSLEFDYSMWDLGDMEAPELEDIWRAQLGYWIQKDVVEAIVAVNNEAAAEVERNERWVGIVPVKEVISIRLTEEAVLPVGEGDVSYGHEPGGHEEALPPGNADMVFTQLGTSSSYEVRQFTLKLIMDQRDIPRLVERICANRFHTLLRLSYEAVPVNREFRGKVYGSEPTVNVVMDFETILLEEAFGHLRPEEEEE